MKDLANADNQIHYAIDFGDLVSTPFQGKINATCWARDLSGDFSEIVDKISVDENIIEVDEETLNELALNKPGQLAREILLNDLKLLKAHGASPVVNIIRSYEKDESHPFFPTDVYSFHVDRSPIPTDTFLCTYHGEPSEILPNAQAEQKVLVPEIRDELKKIYDGADDDFESFLSEYFFDLHYTERPGAHPISLGVGHMWRLAIDYPGSKVLPCIHRAPKEKNGQPRLLLIC